MMGLEQIRNNSELTGVIDWEMTPEEAVTLYLEWGNNPANGRRRIRSKNDVSYYFVVNTWEDPARIYFIRRNSEEAVELATIDMPEELRNRFLESVSHLRGVYAVNDDVKAWLEEQLYEQGTNDETA
jgi:Cu/Ag efflux pump CusA